MKQYRVEPDSKVNLSKWDPNEKVSFEGGKKAGKKALLALNDRLEALQEMLYAERKHRVLVVLQAMDTGGKDGTIRHVFEGVNPMRVKLRDSRVTRDLQSVSNRGTLDRKAGECHNDRRSSNGAGFAKTPWRNGGEGCT